MSEADWMAQLIDPQKGLATAILGWEVVHFRPARTNKGWRTPVTGSMGKGWPDLILARPPRLVVAELKSDTGTLDPEQARVLDVLRACGLEVYVWRPRDLEEVLTVLQRR